MKKELKTIFYKTLTISSLIVGIAILVVIIITIYFWKLYYSSRNNIAFPIVFTLFFVGLIIYFIMHFIPYIKDWKEYIKTNICEQIQGHVIHYKKTILGGEPETTHVTPIIKNSKTGVEIELEVSGTKLNVEYRFFYLKHTKLAVFEEIFTNN